MKFVLILGLIAFVGVAVGSSNCAGCARPADREAARKTLEFSLSKLAAGDGPNYKIIEIKSASVQVVAGSMHKIDAVLEDEEGKKKECNVSIWSQPWRANGIQVTFDCVGEAKITKTHSA